MTATEPLAPAWEWHIEAVDVDAYLSRIDHPRVAPSAEALRSLHHAHVRTIPFENVDVVLGTHRGLDLDVINEKLVHRPRGGYCFEHALLFAAVLEQLGYAVQRWIARVNPHRSGSRTHMLLRVDVDGEVFLADVGFGAGILNPMPLHDGAVVDQAGWPHRLSHNADGTWTLAKQTEDGWEPMHESEPVPQRPLDYEIAHHYVSTHPDSPFTGRLIIIRTDDGASRRLVGNQLEVSYPDGTSETTAVEPGQLRATLADLGVQPTEAELAALLPVYAGQ